MWNVEFSPARRSPIDPSTRSLRILGRDDKSEWNEEGVIPSEAEGGAEESMAWMEALCHRSSRRAEKAPTSLG